MLLSTWGHQFYYIKQYELQQSNDRAVILFCPVMFNIRILIRSLWIMLTLQTDVVVDSTGM